MKKEIQLDFTSLLDITLILLFFFVIFSTFDAQENREKTENKAQEYEAAIQEANVKKSEYEAAITDAEYKAAEAEELKAQLNEEIVIVRKTYENQASDAEEKIQFSESKNIKIILDMLSDEEWQLRIQQGESVTIIPGADIEAEKIIGILEKAEYTSKDTILCEFIYNGSEDGSNRPRRWTENVIEEVKKTYPNLYTSKTNIAFKGE